MSTGSLRSGNEPSIPPNNPAVLNLVQGKRAWGRRVTPSQVQQGFSGWRERGYLPHFDAPDVTQFVTYMLKDAFPAKRRAELEGLMNKPGESSRRRRIEEWLDRGQGECWLRQRAAASRVEQLLRENDVKDYCLRAWVIMPNHVHLVVDVWRVPLSHLVKQWKGRSARELNQLLDRSGSLWEREYYDTLIKDDAHLRRAVHYTEANPVNAGLARHPAEWPWSSAKWRDAFGCLPTAKDGSVKKD